ncbi:MAG TPA: hypothetical protein PK511_12080 [Chitinophagales bacterium]|nr:hypothetical protein [Chitinophagales bacterium]HMU70714.1 hypothetical protein [Chitinophagales bacterium]HMZ89927.1 hypothetical protein [Chitinophagales bacterium]HNA58060.1 hypothetical protein [Chitinophagales bacterium]HNE45439.1 hypothetical protein [Chitinophagales bacterium]
MELHQKLSRLKAIVSLAEEDLQKFTDKGNKTAGTRLRKSLLEIKEIAGDMRKEVLESKKVKV